jgi:hypothetical protein
MDEITARPGAGIGASVEEATRRRLEVETREKPDGSWYIWLEIDGGYADEAEAKEMAKYWKDRLRAERG